MDHILALRTGKSFQNTFCFGDGGCHVWGIGGQIHRHPTGQSIAGNNWCSPSDNAIITDTLHGMNTNAFANMF